MRPPPRLSSWLLEVLLSPHHDAVLGDLEEEFYDHAEAYGRRHAAWRYRAALLTTVPPFLAQAFAWRTRMLANYLKIAVRTLLKQRGFSTINVLGLAVSLSLCLLILLFIQDQRRYDQFHEKGDRVYRVTTHLGSGNNLATSPHSLGQVLRADHPGVEATVRLRPVSGVVSRRETSVPVRGFYAEAAFFDVFSFGLARGRAEGALAEPNTVVLSQAAAEKFFPGQDPLGQVLTFQEGDDYTVTGVLAPLPSHSSLTFEALFSFASLDVDRAAPDWGGSMFQFYTYVLLAPGAAPDALAAQFPGLIAQHYTGNALNTLAALRLQPLTDIRLGPTLANQHSPTLPRVVFFALAGIALLVMLTACFNYMSLSVARALKRAREVGVRKVVGARRGQLAAQFITEAVLVALLAFIGAFGLLFWLVQAFNHTWAVQTIGAQITLDFARDLSVYALFLTFTLVVGVVAGLYPALYLSSFRPVRVLKGLPAARGFTHLGLRKALMVAQFTFSLVFIISTLLFYQQSKLVLTSEMGFDREQIVNVPLDGASYEAVRDAFARVPQVAGLSATSFLPGTSFEQSEAIWTTVPTDPVVMTALYAADEGFVDNLGLTLLAGRTFSPDFATDTTDAAVINETAVRALGLGAPHDALGRQVKVGFAPLPEQARTYTVVGVVKDYRHFRLERAAGPMLLFHRPDAYGWLNVRLHPGDPRAALAALEAAWQQAEGVTPFSYHFFDDQLAEEYAIYGDAIGMLGVVSGFALLIAFLGLFGMATYTVETRTKEVGVRKVMGADVPGLLYLLSKDFLLLVALAGVLALPASWFVNNLWMQQFATRPALDAWIFGLPVAALLALALLTVGSQTLRAALANPVDTLRYE